MGTAEGQVSGKCFPIQSGQLQRKLGENQVQP